MINKKSLNFSAPQRTRNPSRLERERSTFFEELLCSSYSSSEESDCYKSYDLQEDEFCFDTANEVAKEMEIIETKKIVRILHTPISKRLNWTEKLSFKLDFGPKIESLKCNKVTLVIPDEDI